MQQYNDQKLVNFNLESSNLNSLKSQEDLSQVLLESIPEPCFIIYFKFTKTVLVNLHLAELFGYSSSLDFYNNTSGLYDLIGNKDIVKFKTDLGKVRRFAVIKNRKYCFIKKGGIPFDGIAHLKLLSESTSGQPYGYFGTISPGEKYSTFQIDKSLLNLFNDDKFLDEAMVIMDFKGNILVSNRKFYLIDFFGEFSAEKMNLFSIIDKTYQKKLLQRIKELKNGVPTPLTEYKLVNDNNRNAFIEVYSKLTLYKKRKVIVSLIRDISIRKETEKKLLHMVVQTEEKERQRFARDLHDELGPFLSGLKLYLHELGINDTDSERRKMLIDYLGQMTDEAVDKIRTIASNLMPQDMIDIGLSGSIEKMIYKLNQSGRIHIDLETEGNDTGVEQSFIITLYRIILELINNSIKHAESTSIRIHISFQKKIIRLLYLDDGKGFDLKNALLLNKGIGLKSIINRIELYKGTYKFKRRQPRGIEFELYFPL